MTGFTVGVEIVRVKTENVKITITIKIKTRTKCKERNDSTCFIKDRFRNYGLSIR